MSRNDKTLYKSFPFPDTWTLPCSVMTSLPFRYHNKATLHSSLCIRFRSQDIVISIATGWTVQGSNPERSKRFFSSPKPSRPSRATTQSPTEWVSRFRSGAQQPGREVGYTLPSSAEVKNKYSLISTPSICLYSVYRKDILHCVILLINKC
jgi:hypothetical protein